MGVRLVTDEDLRRAAEAAERAAAVQAAAISRALEERGAGAPASGRLLPEAKAVRADTASDRLTRRVEALREAAARAAAPAADPGEPATAEPEADDEPGSADPEADDAEPGDMEPEHSGAGAAADSPEAGIDGSDGQEAERVRNAPRGKRTPAEHEPS